MPSKRFSHEQGIYQPAHFWRRVDSSGGPTACWRWTGPLDPLGYGRTPWRLDGEFKNYLAHRIALALSQRPPAGAFALHACDNPSCCNPRHLRWGTHQDNMDDAKARERVRAGVRHNFSKYDDTTVLTVRRLVDEGCSQASVSRQTGVSASYVSRLVNSVNRARTLGA